MGHYLADIMCDRCGNRTCTCPTAEQVKPACFIITDDYRVVSVDQFDAEFKARNPTSTVSPTFHRWGKREFEKRDEAKQFALELCEKAFEKACAEVNRLSGIMHLRPWEDEA